MVDTRPDFDPLEFDRYTEYHLLARELAETSTDLETVAAEFGLVSGDFEANLLRQSRLIGETRDSLMRVRMLPVGVLTPRLRRVARATAREVSKEVEFFIEGEGVELDRSLVEGVADPLMHLIRNAIDHGLESAEERIQRPVSRRQA